MTPLGATRVNTAIYKDDVVHNHSAHGYYIKTEKHILKRVCFGCGGFLCFFLAFFPSNAHGLLQVWGRLASFTYLLLNSSNSRQLIKLLCALMEGRKKVENVVIQRFITRGWKWAPHFVASSSAYELVQAQNPKFRQPRMLRAIATRHSHIIFGIMLTAMNSGRGWHSHFLC